MSNWFHRFFYPHCVHCANENICESCETLREQLARANEEKKQLLETILESVKPKVEVPVQTEVKLEQPRQMPWRVKREMLEAEDRQKAMLLKKKENELSIDKTELKELEKEMDIAAKERENAS